MSSSVPTYNVCGIKIAALTPQRAAARVVAASTSRTRLEVHLCNAYTLSLVDVDPELAAALKRADVNLPDGAPVGWLGRRHGTRGPVRGPGLVLNVARAGAQQDVRHYLYGGAPGVATQMAAGLRRFVAGVAISGCEAPPYRLLSDDEVRNLAHRIQRSGANIVWVGLGTPRQDYLVPRLAAHLDMPVVPVGAAFDFVAGGVSEAPQWAQGRGIEWIYRLASEPRRLWRRYLFGNPRFVASAIRHRIRQSRG